MITLALINFILDIGSRFITNIFSNLFDPLNDLTYITAFAIPQTILDTYSLVCYFLPITTIVILLGFTITLILLKSIVSVIHFLGLGIIFGE